MELKDILQLLSVYLPYLFAACGFIYGWIKRKYQLNDNIIKALDVLDKAGINSKTITEIIDKANDYVNYSNDQKRNFVADELKNAATRNGIDLSDSTLNYIIEHIFAETKD